MTKKYRHYAACKNFFLIQLSNSRSDPHQDLRGNKQDRIKTAVPQKTIRYANRLFKRVIRQAHSQYIYFLHFPPRFCMHFCTALRLHNVQYIKNLSF